MSTRTKLRIGGQSGLDVYCVIRNDSDQIWDGTNFVTFSAGDYGDYDIPMTEQGSSGYYSVDMPTAITTVGWYHVNYQAEVVSGSPAQTDDVIFQELIKWNGQAITETLANGTSITDICNLALHHLGHTKEIANFETENSEAARVCRRYFATARDETMRAFPWPFLTQFATLGLIENNPTTEWEHSYRYPSDCLRVRRLLSGTRNDTRQSREPYKIVKDSTGLTIYTDLTSAVMEYTVKETNPSFYPDDFIMALSFKLAGYMAPSLTRGDNFKLGDRALQMFTRTLMNAEAVAANEQQDEEEVDSQFIRTRS